jgi:5-methylcytosine-specific restriction endonuclease McrA
VGNKSGNWKHGNSSQKFRGSLRGELKVWREAVYARDNYICKICGNGGELNAHHIKPISDYPELALNVDNGVTLCIDCHEKEHGRSLRHFTRSQPTLA